MAQPINVRPITTGRVVSDFGVKKSISRQADSKSFEAILNREIEQVDMKFSAHALRRIEERNIHLSEKDLGDLSHAVKNAEAKGIRDSLVVMRDVALIVNIPNKTVVTAVDSKSIKENVFTNIDGAVFI
ncbi:MAG: hypothetical protein PHF89_00835 [Eubacteriales bacterium]|jgi:flagellar operon protein|nr:hypothetical protein [Eubacteriales bacterium]